MMKKITMVLVLAAVGVAAGYFTFVPALDKFIEMTRNVKKNNLTYNNGWTTAMDIGGAKASPVLKAYAARLGIGAHTTDEAIYWITMSDIKGERLLGGRSYEVRFAQELEIDKLRGFWSICVYNSKDLFVPNPLKRYNLGDRSPLTRNKDGSLTIYLSPDQPSNVDNWLPIPKEKEPLSLVIRMYAPLPGVLKAPERTPLPTVVRTTG